jgi:signal transduction histidine kinase
MCTGEEKYALSDPGPQPIPGSVREAVLDSAQTIMLCAQHQKRIVDDILTISKSESCRLQICPDQVEPIALVEKALQMYEAELASAAITAGFVVDPSYHELVVGHVLVDRARLLQVWYQDVTTRVRC